MTLSTTSSLRAASTTHHETDSSTSGSSRSRNSASKPARKKAGTDNALLDKLKGWARPGAMSVVEGPMYTYTAISPLPTSALPSPSSSTKADAATPSVNKDTQLWIAKRAQGLTHKLHAPASPELAAKSADADQAIRDEAAFSSTVSKLFSRGSASPAHAAHLSELTAELIEAAYTRPTEGEHVRFAGVLECARTLATATEGNAAQALDALAYLRHAFGGSVRNEANARPISIDVERQAWHAARMLSHTTVGFDALVALREDPTLHEDSENGAMKREGLHTFLKAADYLAQRAPHGAPSEQTPSEQWTDAMRRLSKPRDPANAADLVALNALVCAAKVHAAPHASAQEIGDVAQVDAYVAWRSGYHEGGKGSALARSQSRIAKFMTWVERAEKRATTRTAAWNLKRLVGKRKSPLTSITYDAGGANLSLVSNEAKALQEAVAGALDALTQHFQTLIKDNSLTPEQRGVILLRNQCVKCWKTWLPQQPKATSLKLSPRHRDTIATTMLVVAPPEDLDARTILSYREFKDLKRLDLRTLGNWADEANLLGPRPQSASDPHEHIDLARMIGRSRPIKPAEPTQDAFRKTLVDVLAETPLGNNVRYFDGGTYGLNVGTSMNMADWEMHKAAFGLSIGPTGKMLRGRHAFVEIGSSSYGGEVFFGIDKRRSTGVGVGLFGGFSVGGRSVHATFGLGGGGLYSRDTSGPSGVIFRTRIRRDEDGKVTNSWREHATDIVNFLYEQSALARAAQPPSHEALWQRFSARFFRTPDISVNWREQRRSSHTVSAAGGAMARVAVGGLRIGPALNASHDNVLAGKNERIDTNGWLRGTERTRTRASSITGAATLVGATSSPGHFSTRSGHPESISIPSVPILGAMATFAPRGASVILRMVDEHGRLNPKYIRSLVEFVDKKSFVAHVESRRSLISRTPRSKPRLDQFIREVKKCAIRGNQAYGESLKIVPAIAEELTAYQADIATIMRCANGAPNEADREQIALLDDKIASKLGDPKSWTISGYYSYEVNTKGYTAGPSFLLQATAITTTAGERVLAELAMSELEALDDPDSAPQGGGGGVH